MLLPEPGQGAVLRGDPDLDQVPVRPGLIDLVAAGHVRVAGPQILTSVKSVR